MGETAIGEDLEKIPEPTTQRLSFDKEVEDKDIPQFLKKGRRSKAKAQPEPEPESEPEDNVEPLEPEAEVPTSVDYPTENEKMPTTASKSRPTTSGQASPAINEAALQNLAELTIEQLKVQQAEIDRRIQEKQAIEKKAVIEQIQQVVRDYNIPVEELVEALGGIKFKRKGTKAKAKYRDPATGTTWSGRGKEPAWIKGVPDRTPFLI